MKPIRVLLVEDDGPHARLIAERLRDVPELELVATCEALAEAIARARELGPRGLDAVLLDLGLPDSEGGDTVRAFHVAAPRLPIVVLSGLRDVGTAIEAMRHGAQDYLVKSAGDAAELSRALRLAIERKRLQDVEQMLVGVVSHDLRGPLQTIVLGCDMLLGEQPGSRHAAVIRRAALRATTLVNDLLDATRARLAGVLPIEMSDLDLVTVIEQVVEDARLAHPRRSIELALELGERVSARGDGKRIAQVVQNLLGNALQHSPPASAVRVSLTRRPQWFELVIHNHGAPIPEALRQHMFEPLERASGDRDAQHSIGLGLYIVSEIVRAHGGVIQVDSDGQRGTTFSVRLPALPSSPAPPPS
jgi:signal transduction histidine kinase